VQLVMSLADEVSIRLAGALHAISPFSMWSPATELLGAIEDYFCTGVGLTEKEYRRAIRWTEKIGALDNRLVQFYSLHCGTEITANVAMWKILEGGTPLMGWQYRKLKKLWEDQFALPPSIEMCPCWE